MKQAELVHWILSVLVSRIHYRFFIVFCAGLIMPLGFAPFHFSGFTQIGLALFFSQLLKATNKQGFFLGLTFGIGYFGLGISWIIISIHDYGQINYLLAALITLVFIFYLAVFPALASYLFKLLQPKYSALGSAILFSILWCLSEYLRSSLLTGFPWLLIGTSQIDTPLRELAPVCGIYGLSLICAFSASLMIFSLRERGLKRYYYLITFIFITVSPSLLQFVHWTKPSKTPISIGAVQANLAMRDKWDEAFFWDLIKHYQQATDKLLGRQLIIWPESAIPLPANDVEPILKQLNQKLLNANTALILGILQNADDKKSQYYNSAISLGHAKGQYNKQRLVPFGEYIPRPFLAINRWLGLPEPNIIAGERVQPLIKVFDQPIAMLICYEIAFPNLLREQLSASKWIVSISDNGWFGHSLASYQQLQMAQMLSLQTGKYQVLVNNDGLSSIISSTGRIEKGLSPFSSGILQGEVFESDGLTPWVLWGDYPILVLCALCLMVFLIFRLKYHPVLLRARYKITY